MKSIITNYIAFIPFSTATILFIAAFWSATFPPKKINGLMGYRTTRSMASQTAWEFAQRYWGQLTMKLSLALALFGFIGLAIGNIGLPGLFVGMGAFLATTIISIVLTESQLKKLIKE